MCRLVDGEPAKRTKLDELGQLTRSEPRLRDLQITGR
jgi:hypothetical protein